MADKQQDETIKNRITELLGKGYTRGQLINDLGFAERTVAGDLFSTLQDSRNPSIKRSNGIANSVQDFEPVELGNHLFQVRLHYLEAIPWWS
jgi:hypothetical protein